MKTISLSNGMHCLVDDADYDWAKQYIWHCVSGYAKRTVRKSDGRYTKLAMHRELLGCPPFVDHANRVKLDNRRANLRPCTKLANNVNRDRKRNAKEPYLGVKRNGPNWAARIADRHLGQFKTAEEAARAYDVAAKIAYGEFARLNFPEDI